MQNNWISYNFIKIHTTTNQMHIESIINYLVLFIAIVKRQLDYDKENAKILLKGIIRYDYTFE